MAVLNTTIPFIYYKITVIQPNFDFLFQIDQNSDLLVQLNGTDLVLSTDYTIILNGTLGGTVVLDATIVANLQLNDILYLARQISLDRLTNYEDGQDFSADTLNKDLDRITLQNQQVNASYVGQSFIFPTDYTDGNATAFNLLPSDIPENSFLKKQGTAFAAVQIEENPNCSTLRSDLLVDSPPGATGATIVGSRDLDGLANTVQGTINQLPVNTLGSEGASKVGVTNPGGASTIQATITQYANSTPANEGAMWIGASDNQGATNVQSALNHLYDANAPFGATLVGATSPEGNLTNVQAIFNKFLPVAYGRINEAATVYSIGVPAFNILSIVRSAAGSVRINFITPLSNANYFVIGYGENGTLFSLQPGVSLFDTHFFIDLTLNQTGALTDDSFYFMVYNLS